MKIQHVITSMGVNWGGPALTSLLTLKGLRSLGIDATMLTYDVSKGDRLISKERFITCLPALSRLSRFWGYSLEMKSGLEVSDADVYHVQGLWQYPGYAAAQIAERSRIPYVITLHGQLYPQALAFHTWRKQFALLLYQRQQLQAAACIHATCMEEYRHYRALGFTNPVAVIPNPLEWTEKSQPLYTDGVNRIGFMGRFHPIKRIDRLLEAWSRIATENTELVLIGEGSPEYVRCLEGMIENLKIRNVCFTGFLIGKEKEQLLASLCGLILPSDSENFGMVVPEALLQGVPVIASTGTPWEELNAHRCGWWVKNDVDTLLVALQEALALNQDTRYAMGERGRKLIEENYSMDSVADRMKRMYEWVLRGGDKPDFVY